MNRDSDFTHDAEILTIGEGWNWDWGSEIVKGLAELPS